jgi:hypothetical protein
LIWTRDVTTPGPTLCNPGTTKTWQGALDYVKCLNTNGYLGYTDWRLPNPRELRSLINYGAANTSTWLYTQWGFEYFDYNYHWSSSTLARDNIRAWYGYLLNGMTNFDNKTGNHNVWPVRGGQSGSLAILGDFDSDGDVDGNDLAALIANQGLLDISTFATNYGRSEFNGQVWLTTFGGRD